MVPVWGQLLCSNLVHVPLVCIALLSSHAKGSHFLNIVSHDVWLSAHRRAGYMCWLHNYIQPASDSYISIKKSAEGWILPPLKQLFFTYSEDFVGIVMANFWHANVCHRTESSIRRKLLRTFIAAPNFTYNDNTYNTKCGWHYLKLH